VRFGILGTGVVGRTIAARLDGMGLEAMVGTRDPEETTSRTEPDTYGNPHSAFGSKRNTPRSGSPRSAKRPHTVRWLPTPPPAPSP
jgi:hypothetical protein